MALTINKLWVWDIPVSPIMEHAHHVVTVVVPRRPIGWRNGIPGHQRLSETERNFKRLTAGPILRRRLELQHRQPVAPTEEQITADYRDHWSAQSRTDARHRLFTCGALFFGLVIVLASWLSH